MYHLKAKLFAATKQKNKRLEDMNVKHNTLYLIIFRFYLTIPIEVFRIIIYYGLIGQVVMDPDICGSRIGFVKQLSTVCHKILIPIILIKPKTTVMNLLCFTLAHMFLPFVYLLMFELLCDPFAKCLIGI